MEQLAPMTFTRRTALLLVTGLIMTVMGSTALQASGDFGCSPSWKLNHTSLTGCDSMVMLSPGNDTRVNLALLMEHQPDSVTPADPDDSGPSILFDWASFEKWSFPKPDEVGNENYVSGEGSRCLSDTGGSADFAAAVATARRLSAGEKAALTDARRALKPSCAGPAEGDAVITALPGKVKSRSALDFATYLSGASSFYAGDFDAAQKAFAALSSSREAWVSETARYMLGRVELNRAQVGVFDEYGYRDDTHQIDAKATAAAEAALHAYLKSYPRGRYAASARGLLRKVYWLGGDTAKLAAKYEVLLSQSVEQRGIGDAELAEEIDNKLLPQLTAKDTSSPILLAVLDLRNMRDAASGPDHWAELDVQRVKFAKAPALFDYLLAAHAFYIAQSPREALKHVPDAVLHNRLDPVAFSRQMLRGMALDATNDPDARGYWLELIGGAKAPTQSTTVELALALHEERSDGLERVFARGSPVRDATIRDTLLAHVAGASLLRRQSSDAAASAHERAVARFTLIYKDLTHGVYRDFLRDIEDVSADATPSSLIYDFVGGENPSPGTFLSSASSEDYPCPQLKISVARLANVLSDAKAQLCVAEFIRLNNLDGYFLDHQPPADELGGTKSQFAGAPIARLDRYQAVIASPNSPPADRAYALYRAVRCYAPSQNNECGGEGVPLATRKAWFQRMHREFPKSPWTQDLPYYW